MLIGFQHQLLFEVTDFILHAVLGGAQFRFRVLELRQDFVQIIDFILFYLKISLSAMRELHVVPLQRLQLLVDPRFLLSVNQALVLVF